MANRKKTIKTRTVIFSSDKLADEGAAKIQERGGLILKIRKMKNDTVKVTWTDY